MCKPNPGRTGRSKPSCIVRERSLHKVTSPSGEVNDSSVDEEVRRVLEEQHRQVINRIRTGDLESPTT